MASAIYYLATAEDQMTLLDYLGEPAKVTLHPWWVVDDPMKRLTRHDALRSTEVMIAAPALGVPVAIRPGDPAMKETSKAGVFNRINWDRIQPTDTRSLIDSNFSPVLFWRPGVPSEGSIWLSDIGSQADNAASVSVEYDRWMNRVFGWIRRRGTRVWGLERAKLRPDLDLRLELLNAVYALPVALSALESGATGRS